MPLCVEGESQSPINIVSEETEYAGIEPLQFSARYLTNLEGHLINLGYTGIPSKLNFQNAYWTNMCIARTRILMSHPAY